MEDEDGEDHVIIVRMINIIMISQVPGGSGHLRYHDNVDDDDDDVDDDDYHDNAGARWKWARSSLLSAFPPGGGVLSRSSGKGQLH